MEWIEEKGYYVDALNGRLFVIDNDRINVSSKNDRDGGLEPRLGGLAEIDNSPVNA